MEKYQVHGSGDNYIYNYILYYIITILYFKLYL